ncbi:recombinase family protein [Evansella sp. LMS18]|jgi:DNA invertase Pin-like site-specific DNA recombinase|uniref:recombinase family protein n=1 Tax=Evansella sp. LMS18 TaxID=2924033 RepID=UPI0020D08020|nr:recombinase family protein [Evansella sp. LMS18]UTR09433.1 recombinase family protein [Evansella sp. LMS18]
MKYGYARVSTVGQDLESQVTQLKAEGCEIIYSEKFTGTKKSRPEFMKLLETVNQGDMIVVTKLDRFARSAADAISIVRDLFNRGIRVHILNMGLIENTPTGKLIFTIMSGFAEFERDMIVERTQEGKAIAKQRDDYREGRPRLYSKKQIEHALGLLESHSYKEVEQLTGISKSTLIRAKRKKAVN